MVLCFELSGLCQIWPIKYLAFYESKFEFEEMRRLLDLRKLPLRRSAMAIDSGGSSYDAFLRPLLRSLDSVPFHVLREPFQHRSVGSAKLSSENFSWFFVRRGRTYVSTSGISSHLAVGARSLRFSFLQKKGFGAWQPNGFWRSYW